MTLDEPVGTGYDGRSSRVIVARHTPCAVALGWQAYLVREYGRDIALRRRLKAELQREKPRYVVRALAEAIPELGQTEPIANHT